MFVPALFASTEGESLVASEAWFQGTAPRPIGGPVPFEQATSSLPRGEERAPVVVVDCDSLSSYAFTENVLKGMRVRGRDIWFMTWIETADDLFDAFNTTAEMVMGPYHAVASDTDLKDIYSVSDSFIPVLYIRNGKPMVRRRQRGGGTVYDTMGALADAGFYRTCVLDTDDSMSENDWSSVLDDFPSAVPFTRNLPSTEASKRNWISPQPFRGIRPRIRTPSP